MSSSNRLLFGMGDNDFEQMILQNSLTFDLLDSIDDYQFYTLGEDLKLKRGNLGNIITFDGSLNVNVDNNLTVGGNFTNSGNLITGGNLTIGGDLEVNDIEVNIIKIGDSFITSNDDLDVVSQTIDYPTYSPYDSIPTQSLIITNVPSYEPLSKINVGYFQIILMETLI